MDGHVKVLQNRVFFFLLVFISDSKSTALHMVVLSQAKGFEISDIFHWKGLSLLLFCSLYCGHLNLTKKKFFF